MPDETKANNRAFKIVSSIIIVLFAAYLIGNFFKNARDLIGNNRNKNIFNGSVVLCIILVLIIYGYTELKSKKETKKLDSGIMSGSVEDFDTNIQIINTEKEVFKMNTILNLLFYTFLILFLFTLYKFIDDINQIDSIMKYAFYMENECGDKVLEKDTTRYILYKYFKKESVKVNDKGEEELIIPENGVGAFGDRYITLISLFIIVIFLCILFVIIYMIIIFADVRSYEAKSDGVIGGLIEFISALDYRFGLALMFILIIVGLFIISNQKLKHIFYIYNDNNSKEYFNYLTKFKINYFTKMTAETIGSYYYSNNGFFTRIKDYYIQDTPNIQNITTDDIILNYYQEDYVNPINTIISSNQVGTINPIKRNDYLKKIIERITHINNLDRYQEAINLYNKAIEEQDYEYIIGYIDFKNDSEELKAILGPGNTEESEIVKILTALSDYSNGTPMQDKDEKYYTYYIDKEYNYITSKFQVHVTDLKLYCIFLIGFIVYLGTMFISIGMTFSSVIIIAIVLLLVSLFIGLFARRIYAA